MKALTRHELEEIKTHVEFMKRDPEIPYPHTLCRLLGHIEVIENQLNVYESEMRDELTRANKESARQARQS